MAVEQELSISDPRFNVREIAKQLILLEQHLLEKGKYCPDCITKHILTIEALSDECQSLDKEQQWCFLAFTIGERAKLWARAFSRGAAPKIIGQDVRAWRKKVAQNVLVPAVVTDELDLAGMDTGRKATNVALTVVVVGMLAIGAVMLSREKEQRRGW